LWKLVNEGESKEIPQRKLWSGFRILNAIWKPG
jgi:hypothetical protein